MAGEGLAVLAFGTGLVARAPAQLAGWIQAEGGRSADFLAGGNAAVYSGITLHRTHRTGCAARSPRSPPRACLPATTSSEHAGATILDAILRMAADSSSIDGERFGDDGRALRAVAVSGIICYKRPKARGVFC
jgi:hypothetical protein